MPSYVLTLRTWIRTYVWPTCTALWVWRFEFSFFLLNVRPAGRGETWTKRNKEVSRCWWLFCVISCVIMPSLFTMKSRSSGESWKLGAPAYDQKLKDERSRLGPHNCFRKEQQATPPSRNFWLSSCQKMFSKWNHTCLTLVSFSQMCCKPPRLVYVRLRLCVPLSVWQKPRSSPAHFSQRAFSPLVFKVDESGVNGVWLGAFSSFPRLRLLSPLDKFYGMISLLISQNWPTLDGARLYSLSLSLTHSSSARPHHKLTWTNHDDDGQQPT